MNETIKDYIIEDDDNLPIIFACSIYDTKPVHILGTIIDNITWTTETKEKIFDKSKKALCCN